MGFGKSFLSEVIAAGLGGLPFSWGNDGTIEGRDNLTPEQNAVLDAVVAAHVDTSEQDEEIEEIKSELADIDLMSVRSLRAFATWSFTQIDVDRLSSLEAIAQSYRDLLTQAGA